MYNPQGSNTGREWIELYNQGGSDVTMVGGSAAKTWRVQDGANNNALHTLTDPSGGTGRGTLVVPAGGYLIVASDPTEFISGEYAGGSYSAVKSALSLSSSGASISLIDQTSGTASTIDSVPYTSAQGGADDGTSLQRQPDGSWLAALPTPGALNATVAYTPPAASDSSSSNSSQQTATSSTTQTASTVAPVSSYVAPPTPNLFADAGDDRTVIVGADVEFDGHGYDRNQNPLDPSSTRFSWNFGDGGTAEGTSVLHHFDYPGRYAVVLSIASGVYGVSDTIRVNAEAAALSFTVLPDGGVAIQNRAGHDLDLSGWVVRQSGAAFAPQFMLAAHSEILSGGTMQIGTETLKFRASADASLEYPNGVVALGAGETTTVSPQPPTSAATTSAVVAAAEVVAPSSASPADDAAATSDDTAQASDDSAAPSVSDASPASSTQVAAPAAAHIAFPSGKIWWWLGAILLALGGGAALMVSRGAAKHEWDIEEMKN